jgi:GTP-binding protein LepA
MENIRNFSIIAHIDHGKSTLADRMLEITGTVPERKMREQVLDQMDLERERGITIKMTPVRMAWTPRHAQALSSNFQTLNKSEIRNTNDQNSAAHLGFRDSDLGFANSEYILNLIDTPGHIDFSYEVSRALSAVEGVVLLVDATQGIQAQTLSVLELAKAQGLAIIPALSKVDAALARIDDIRRELALLLNCNADGILLTSGKTGEGVPELLEAIITQVPPPSCDSQEGDRALVFDFEYSDHRGIVVFVRVKDGSIKKGDKLRFFAADTPFSALETGVFTPEELPTPELKAGEIGYVVTGIKKPGVVNVGDTVFKGRAKTKPLPGYLEPRPVIWASVYPESQDDFESLRQALLRLHLIDSSLSFEEESSGIMGRGFRCGFLGMLHMEIITERLRREFNLELVVTLPTTVYEVRYHNGDIEEVYTPTRFPDDSTASAVREEWVRVRILTPASYVGTIMQLLHEHEATVSETETMPDERTQLVCEMPLREMMRNFFDKLKNASSGFGSLSYERIGKREADVIRLDVLIAEELAPAFSRIVSRRRIEEEARKVVAKLKESLPRQLFVVKIQARAQGRIIASEKLSARRKDVTGYLYGGDVTRKKKLLEKQKKGKKKMLARGKVHIPHEVFMKVMKSD